MNKLPSIKSLNISKRKKHVSEIQQANRALAMRLITKPPYLSFREFEDNFIRHQYIGNMLNKTKKITCSQCRLPPSEIYTKTASNFNLKSEQSNQNCFEVPTKSDIKF